MSRGLTTHINALLLCLLTLPAWAQSPMQESLHNLTTENTDERQVCMACHIPGGDDNGNHDPLWQQQGKLPQSGFRTFDTLGLTGGPGADAGDTGSVSVACLSCHDDTQAPRVQGLQEGSPPNIANLGGEEWNNNVPLPSSALGSSNSSSNHPVGVEYARGRFSGLGDSQKNKTPDNLFARTQRPASEFHTPQRDVIGGQVIWWLGGGGTREKEDVQLFTRVSLDGQAIPYIECASCHDPHAVRTNMLRQDNTDSRLCLACHNY